MSTDPMQTLEDAYLLLKDDLLSTAYHLLGDHAAAEDVLQDVFVRFAGDGARIGEARDLRRYLVAACRNRARDHLRRRRRGPASAPYLDDLPAAGEGPPAAAAARDEAGRVSRALGRLPAEQREVVVLRVYGRLRFREIAEVTGAGIDTVQSRYRYALEKLRATLSREGARR